MSALISGAGEPVPQSKFTTASVRVNVGVGGFVNVFDWFEKYAPNNPVPFPNAELFTSVVAFTPLSTNLSGPFRAVGRRSARHPMKPCVAK